MNRFERQEMYEKDHKVGKYKEEVVAVGIEEIVKKAEENGLITTKEIKEEVKKPRGRKKKE